MDDPVEAVRALASVLETRRSWLYGERDLARGLASLHDREQLRKAADAADELVVAALRLSSGGAVASGAGAAVAELGVETIPTTLQWRKRAKRSLAAMSARVRDRHAQSGEVAFLLEPDIKEGRGGLRDVHAQLARVTNVLHEARTRALLEAMRSARPPDP